ncbi:MAG: hypothetical protein WAQ52_01415 [Terriglobales bacterium]
MRALRLCSCASLLGVLLITGGCSGAYVPKGNEQITKEVVIKDCTAVPYTATVFKDDTLTWKVDPADTNTYTVTFPGAKPVPAASFPVKSTVPAPQPIKRSLACMASWNYCYYNYTLTKGQDPCPDPGVHIIPGP